MRKYILLLLIFSFVIDAIYSQTEQNLNKVEIQGIVKDINDNSLPGVTIIVKGSTVGTITDVEGNYKIKIAVGETLSFSFIGMQTQKIKVENQNNINVVMQEDAIGLDEVVITALGIKKSAKSLTYAVQTVNNKSLAESKQENIVNALTGKVAGVQVTSSNGTPGSSSQILIRGASSVNGNSNNQPLFVVDGLPIDNSTSFSGSNRASDINPNDIESISILKGPAASALYGIEAANGAIIITTKSAKNGQTIVEFNSSYGISSPWLVPERQQNYMQGSQGYFNPESNLSYGPKFTPNTPKYNNIDNFFQHGISNKNDILISTSSDKANLLMSGNQLTETGIVPGEKYERSGVLLKGRIKLEDNLSLEASSNIISSKNKRSSTSLTTVYYWPTSDNMENYEHPDGSKRWLLTKAPGEEWSGNLENPYWRIKNNPVETDVYRNISQLSLNWDPIPYMNVSYRIGSDFTQQHYKAITSPESAGTLEAYQGKITEIDKTLRRINSNLHLSYNKKFLETYTFSLLLGNSVQTSNAISTKTTGKKYRNPDLDNLNNLETIETLQSLSKRRVIGLYGDLKLDYNDILYLGFTYRNDWSSTLPVKNNNFSYPSISGGFLFHSFLSPQLQKYISFGKIRANWAKVGKDAPAHNLEATLDAHEGINEGYKNYHTAGNPNLKPETTTSWEIGADLRLLEGRTRIDVTYYEMKSHDQIISARISPASGFIIQTFNTGSVENKGLEIVFEQKIIDKKIKWNVMLNYSHNRSLLAELPSFVSRFPVTSGQLISAAKPSSLLNQPLQGIEGTQYLRNDEGKLVLDEKGRPRIGTYQKDEQGNYVIDQKTGKIKVDDQNVYLGNREPQALVGITNTLSYQNIGLSFLIDIRKGGDVINATAAKMAVYGTLGILDEYRGKVTLFNGVVEQENGLFVENTQETKLDPGYFTSNYSSVGENFVEDASWVRFKYLSLYYDLSSKILEKIKIARVRLSFTANNLLILTKYSGGSPETNYGGAGVGGSGTGGLDYFSVPSVQSFSFALNVKF